MAEPIRRQEHAPAPDHIGVNRLHIELSPEEVELVEKVGRLARDQFAPRAAGYDQAGEFPLENYRDLHAHGLIGLAVPKRYGGCGANALTYCAALEQIAKNCGATALTFNMHSTVVGILKEMGTEEQRRRYFTEVARNGKLFSTLTSEPASSFRGTFVLGTMAHRVDGGYLVNGVKHFASLTGASDYYFVWAGLEGETDIGKGLLNLVIHKDAPGVTINRTWNAMGMRGTSSNSIVFKDCFVPDDAVIGEPGEVLARELTDGFILGYGAVYLGLAQAAYEFTVEYAKTKTFKPDPNPISHQPTIQAHVAEMRMLVDAARLMLQRAAYEREHGTDKCQRAITLNQAKYMSCETAVRVTDMALRVVGGRGFTKDTPLERYLRDARAGWVMPPNHDKCLEIVGRLSMGLRASGGFI